MTTTRNYFAKSNFFSFSCGPTDNFYTQQCYWETSNICKKCCKIVLFCRCLLPQVCWNHTHICVQRTKEIHTQIDVLHCTGIFAKLNKNMFLYSNLLNCLNHSRSGPVVHQYQYGFEICSESMVVWIPHIISYLCM